MGDSEAVDVRLIFQADPCWIWARVPANVGHVPAAYLVGEHDLPEALKNPDMLDRWKALEEIAPEDEHRIPYVADGLTRDARARKAYAAG